ncbi:hypothetical protein GWK08_00825 [Leptobacterium flavescens]|uniref:Uncharacterized protein n=1 Tax=Leptobacterium flavescens TaxID=472055 RepID=A0A6P0UHP3_9FLAO|nr:hypothetical protein [Leptobacterium flavescens]NER11970.1 hypothetical protein [Leptobacterium flavescens]
MRRKVLIILAVIAVIGFLLGITFRLFDISDNWNTVVLIIAGIIFVAGIFFRKDLSK